MEAPAPQCAKSKNTPVSAILQLSSAYLEKFALKYTTANYCYQISCEAELQNLDKRWSFIIRKT
jgi:hypothetical protein